MSEDPHTPTEAGPDPTGEFAAVTPEPSPTVGSGEATFQQPAGSALLGAETVDPHPEKLVGAAFAGGLVTALLLKGMARRKHR